MDDPLLWVGTLALALAASASLLTPRSERFLAAAVAVLVGAPALVVADNWDGDRVVGLREEPLLLVFALVFAVAVVLALARLFAPRPWLFGVAAVATLPFRIPIELGGETANLLLPLYLVVASGTVAVAMAVPRKSALAPPGGWAFAGAGRAAATRDDAPEAGTAGRRLLALVPLLLAGFVVVYALQAAYADDISAAIGRVAFFFAPFAVLLRLLGAVRWDRRLLRLTLIVVAAEALLVAAVAFGQYAVGEIFWNDKVISGNEAHAWFRVNSLFFDPNITGRFLALVMVALAAVTAWVGDRRTALAAAATFVVLLGALTITFSVSSMLALFAGLCAVVALRWGIAWGALAAGAVAVGLVATVIGIGGEGALSEETTGRSGLVSGGLELAEQRPLLGYGSGSFSQEFTERFDPAEGIAVESHTEPVTVAAEQGLVGLVPFTALLAVAAVGMAAAAGLGVGMARDPIMAALLALVGVMIVHSLGYAALMIDPITWALLAVAVTVAAARAPAGAEAPPPAATTAAAGSG